ncbi:hypothetical protein M0805_008596 [Coniferiporia weirii]|nr:hypothetical protein M0805_008596 [Coniferiporia weirii]
MAFSRVDQLTHELEPEREIGHVYGNGNEYDCELEHAARPPAPSPSLPLPQDRAHAGLAPSLLLDAHISSTGANSNSNADLKRARLPPPLAITLPAKPLLASDPPPALTIADSELHAEWHFAREDSAGGVPATEHTGVGAGYFSPPQTPRSPGASTALPLPTPSAQRVHSRSRSHSRSALVSDFAKLASKVRGPPAKMAKERRSLQSILIPSFLQSLQSPLTSASASTSTTPLHVHALNAAPPTRAHDAEASADVKPLRPPSSSVGSELRRSYGRARAQTYTRGSRTSIADTIVGVPSDAVLDDGYAYAYAASAMSPGADGRESPPGYLLDDDPFAPVAPARTDALSRSASIASFSSASDASMPGTPIGASRTLSLMPEQSEPAPSSSPVPSPSATAPPLHVDTNVSVLTFPLSPLASPPLSPRSQTSAATPTRARLPSTGAPPLSTHPRARPAHTRPAFASRPSLPSLSTLARMSAGFGNLGGFAGFGVKVKKRKGKVGAGLPVEPWDLLESQPEPESQSASAESQERGRGRVRERAMTLGEWGGGREDYVAMDDIIFAPNTVGLANGNGNEDDEDDDENEEWEEGGGEDLLYPSGGSRRPYSSTSTVVQADSFFHLAPDDPCSETETASVLTERASAPDEREYARSFSPETNSSTALIELVDGSLDGQDEEGGIPDLSRDTVAGAQGTRVLNLVVPTTISTDGDDDDSSLELAYLRLSGASIDGRGTVEATGETETEEKVDMEARDANEEAASQAKPETDALGDGDDDDGVCEEDGKTAGATSLPEVDGDGTGIKDEAGDGNRDRKGVNGDEVDGDASTSSMGTVRVESKLAGAPESGGRDDVFSESVLPREEEPRSPGSIIIPRGGADDNSLGRNAGGQSATHTEFLDSADAERKVEEEDYVESNAFPSPYSYSYSYLHPDGASIPVAIPTGHTRASAIPRHVRRTLARSPNSPPSSSLDPSPTSSVEDFGVVLSISPGHFAYAAANSHRDSVRLRPDSLTIDPCLPHPRTPLPSLEQSPQPPVQPPLPLSENEESLRAGAVTGSDSDIDSIDAARDATDATYIITRGSGGLEVSDTLASLSSFDASKSQVEVETETVQKPLESGNVTDVDVDADTDTDIETTATSASEESAQPQFTPPDYFDSDLDDSCMLPPLSTLPEEDPVFSLSPAGSLGSVYGYDDYGSGRSPAISRKASTATTFSSSSAKSNKSYYVANLIGSNSGSSSWTRARHGYGSSSGSVDYEDVVHADVVAAHKLSSRSQSSFGSGSGYEPVDVRGHARRQGSQSSGISLLSSSSRTRYDPIQSAEELSLGLREYTGNPHTAAARAEAVTHLSNGERGFGDDELEHELGHTDLEIPHDVDALLAGWRPFDAEVAGGFEPGSSSGTVRPKQEREQSRAGASRRGSAVRSVAAIGTGQSGAALGRAHTNGYSGSRGGGSGREWGSGGGGGGYGYQGSYGGGGGGNKSSGSDYGDQRGPPGGGRRGRDDGRDDGRRNRRPSVSSRSTTSSESESESDAYGQDEPSPSAPVASKPVAFPASVLPAQEEVVAPVFNQLRNGRKGVFKPPPAAIQTGSANRTLAQGTEDDDVPLAQRIPNALQAQKSIRRQVRDEREKRRRDRSVAPGKPPRTPEDAMSPPSFPRQQQQPFPEQSERGRTISMKPPKGAALGPGPAALSSSQEAALMAQGLLQPPQVPQSAPVMRRPRAKTIGEANAGGVAADDLARRLLKVQTRTDTDANTGLPTYQTSGVSSSQRQPRRTSGELLSAGPYSASPLEHASGSSFSRRSNQGPFTAQVGGHSFQQQQQLQSAAPPTDAPTRTLRPMRSFHNLTSASSLSAPPPAPPVPASPARRPTSSKGRRPSQEQNPIMAKSTRTSLDKASRAIVDDAQYAYHYQQQQQPYVQPLSIPASRPSAASRPESPPRSAFVQSASTAMQTRVYIGDRQHFNMVEVSADMSARDVLDVLAQQGDLRGEERRSSSWILYEVCADFEMERPIRSFELVSDVFGSWPKEKTMNCLMVKRSAFAPLLTTVPSSIPTRSGYVDYETKKGRWNKRWLELREHGLWLSKRQGKDDEFLCSLSAFDAYIVTRSQKTQKTFAFAVKSTDPITLFENKSDYLHTFTCPEDTGRQWVENILLARSYILYQEKRVLFHNKNSSVGQAAGAPTGAGAALSRAGTRKRPAQTFVNLGPGSQTMSGPSAVQTAGPFEPGSLLAKRSAA